MTLRNFLLIALVSGGGPTAIAQSPPQCAPIDSAQVARWHSQWDQVPRDSLRLRALGKVPNPDESGIVTLEQGQIHPVMPKRAQFLGRWMITTVLAQRGGVDWTASGTVTFLLPTDSLKKWYGGSGGIPEDRLVSGHLVGRGIAGPLQADNADSVAIDGAIDRWGHFSFSNRFDWDDGGGFGLVEVDSDWARGWWAGPGAANPPYMGWFCLQRVR